MLTQFWTYTLDDGRRVLVEAGTSPRWDVWIGFGTVRAILPA